MRNFVSSRRLPALLLVALCHAPAAFAVETGLSDPTRPSGFSTGGAERGATREKLSLTLIRLGPEPLAVINGKPIAPGESIAGYRLLSLQTASATLTSGDDRIVLQLASPVRKSSSPIFFKQNHQ